MKDVDRYRRDIYEGLRGSTPEASEDARDLIMRYTREVEYEAEHRPVFGWVNSLDEEDRKECLRELMGHLTAALGQSRREPGKELELLDEAVYAWRASARQAPLLAKLDED